MLVALKFNLNGGQFHKDMSKLSYFKQLKILVKLVNEMLLKLKIALNFAHLHLKYTVYSFFYKSRIFAIES